MRFFDRTVKEQRSVNGWSFENGAYHKIKFAYGEMPPFSQIDEVWDNGDDTLTAIVSVYSPRHGWSGDPHGAAEKWEKSDPQFAPAFKGKYRALISLDCDGDYEKYILLEYLLVQ